MKTLAERMEAMRLELGLKKTDIWKGAGLTSSSYSHWMNGGELNGLNLIKVAAVLNVNPEWLATGRGPKHPDMLSGRQVFFPRVVGSADMGDRGYYVDLDGGDGYVEFESEIGAIAIKVRGHSMHPAIRDGWFVIIEPSGRPTIGEYVLLKFTNGKKMVKELLQIKSDCYVVMSINGNERITAMHDDLEGIEAIAAVIPPSKHKEWVNE